MRSPRLQRLVFVLISLALSIPAVAQSSVYKPGAPLLMWKVSSATNSAYVLGSVHLGGPSLYPLPDAIEDAFKTSSVLIVEVDIRKVDPLAMQKLMAGAAYPAGDDLFHHITPETRAKEQELRRVACAIVYHRHCPRSLISSARVL